MSDAAQIFDEVYDLIEQGNLTAARQLLDNVRAGNQNNPDYWWLYAHAVEDERAGREALQRLQQLQPNYPGIDNLIQKAGISTPRPLQTLRPPQSLPDLPKTSQQGIEDDDFDMDDDFALDDRPPGNTRRNLLILVAIGLIVILVVLAALFLPGLLGGGMQATPTPLAQPVTTLGTIEIIDTTEAVSVPTDEATPTEEEIEPTKDITPTEEATEIIDGDAFIELAAQLADYDVPAEGVEIGETLLGNTLLIATCSPPGPVATQSILSIADTLKAETLSDDIEAIGFRITNCSDDSVLRVIGVSRSDFDDFAADTITAQQLQGLLRPIG